MEVFSTVVFITRKTTNIASVQELFSWLFYFAKACRGESVKDGHSFSVQWKLNLFSRVCLSLNVFSGQVFGIRLNIKCLKKILWWVEQMILFRTCPHGILKVFHWCSEVIVDFFKHKFATILKIFISSWNSLRCRFLPSLPSFDFPAVLKEDRGHWWSWDGLIWYSWCIHCCSAVQIFFLLDSFLNFSGLQWQFKTKLLLVLVYH